MRVLYVVTSFQRGESDVINPWMGETIRRLKKRGVEVTVFTSAWKGQGDHEVAGIPVRRFRYCLPRFEVLSHEGTIPDQIKRNKLHLLLVPLYMVFGMIGAARLAAREKFDLAHVHWPFPLALFGYAAARRAGVPLVNEFYGVELRWVRNTMPVFTGFLRWVVRISDLVVAISTHTRSEIERIAPGTRVEIVPYGSPVPEQPRSRQQESDPGRTRRVLFVGRLVERKGVEYLVRAMKLLDLPFPVELDVVGGGPEAGRLVRLVEELGLGDRVNLLGKVPADELERRYAACDVFVLPAIVDSRGDTEGLGVVLIEALSYHKPVIASNVGGIVDIVADGETGLAVPEKDPGALAGAVSRVLEDSGLAGRLAENGFRRVKEYFDWERIAARWVELYEELAGKR